MTVIPLEDISQEAFAPFGALLVGPQSGSGKVDFRDELENLRVTAQPRLTLMVAHPGEQPFKPLQMERHVHSSQAFLPLGVASDYLVLVAPGSDRDRPDVTRLQAFRVPGHVGINYRPNVWHHPMTTLGQPTRFAVWTFVDGTKDDEEFVPLPEAITIATQG